MSTAAIQRAQPAANIASAVTTAQIFALLSNPLLAAILVIPGSNRLEKKPWNASASGVVTTGTTSNVTPTIYGALVAPGSPLVAANWTLLGASTAVSVVSTSANWRIQIHEAIFDTLSGNLSGTFLGAVGNASLGAGNLTNVLGSINGATEPALVLAVGLTFSVANAGNIGVLADFSCNA